WVFPYLALIKVDTDGRMRVLARYDGDIPGWGGFAEHDRFFVGDFDGDGKEDLYLFNGSDWANPYLAMFRSTGSDFAFVRMFDGDVPGWGGMRSHDRFMPADLTGDGKVDLFAWNMDDWSHEYAGRMISNGSNLSADFREDWVGEWRLGSVDRFERVPERHRIRVTTGLSQAIVIGPLTRKGPDRILAHNTDWMSSFSGTGPLGMNSIYNRWVHNYRFGRNW
ncbi:MAG TPA: VCBS repeat-containing protein, partial [Agromyces sp.]